MNAHMIGMPGLEKRLARYPQFYSRIGFVHEFRPLGAPEVRQLLQQNWAPVGVKLPQTPLDSETVKVIIRVTGGQLSTTEPSADPNPADSRNQHLGGSDQSCGGGGTGEPCNWTGPTIAKMKGFARRGDPGRRISRNATLCGLPALAACGTTRRYCREGAVSCQR
jgi:hypothetical protein